MSQTDFFHDQIAILHMPSWLGKGIHEERALPGAPGDYKITPGERWTVTCLKTNATIYSGIGPIEILRERAAD
ncbi:MAG TPA: hypothetical protein VN280_22505 [Variovorax sp.]|nr:hypothetical protein [Variovorax sp.]